MSYSRKARTACAVLRRKKLRFGSVERWIEEKCGLALLTDAEKQSGVCRACAAFRASPEDFAIDPLGTR